ncbi:signal peptidase I [Ancylomarina sp. 16SWW S1-10-2]|uniref:signal peptidase I n=1 Tax=Ancylomarina sp. 16SWW S1-10-2 TaxID=2499681 RepID=UPI0012AD8E99|nr:signal peptidase I [Ancylomarina sp. 16SWW S1-10-2]
MKGLLKNKWFKFSLAAFTYLLMMLWIGNFWLLLGFPILFDVYISKKVHWAFWKKRGVKKQSFVVEWIDALIFAVVAATLIRMFFIEAYTIPTSSMEKSMLVGDYLFVSKMAYGPKVPNTPLSFPFAHHTMPGTTSTKSYSELIEWPYHRLAGFGDVERNDVVVFNFPAGDTIRVGFENPDYHSQVRSLSNDFKKDDMMKGRLLQSDRAYKKIASKYMRQRFDIRSRPVDKRENYIKRCVGIPGDTLLSIDAQMYVNGKPQGSIENMQFNYNVKTNGTSINPRKLEEFNIAKDDRHRISTTEYVLPLTTADVEELKKLHNVISVTRLLDPQGMYGDVFPFSKDYNWNRDNFGPFVLPKKGVTVELTKKNLPLYDRVISAYEGNKLEVEDDGIYINDQLATSYTFKMDYYWMMGDNRHMSADSRYWGYVPEDHIVGKASFVWLSLDKDKSFLSKIRWNRFFMGIE